MIYFFERKRKKEKDVFLFSSIKTSHFPFVPQAIKGFKENTKFFLRETDKKPQKDQTS